MPSVLRVSLDVIYLNLRQRLIDFLDLEDNQVLIMDPEALPANKHPANPDHYMLLWPAPEQANVPIFRGAGRLDTRLTERFIVTLRSAHLLDDYKERQIWLTDPGVGHLVLRNQIWDALLEYNPVDSSDNALTIGPLEPAQSTTPKSRDAKHYVGESNCGFQFIYMPALTSLLPQ